MGLECTISAFFFLIFFFLSLTLQMSASCPVDRRPFSNVYRWEGSVRCVQVWVLDASFLLKQLQNLKNCKKKKKKSSDCQFTSSAQCSVLDSPGGGFHRPFVYPWRSRSRSRRTGLELRAAAAEAPMGKPLKSECLRHGRGRRVTTNFIRTKT